MNSEAESDHVVLRLPRDVAEFLERTIWDVNEHIAGGRPIERGPPELEQELATAMWELREALGQPHPYDGARPPSRARDSYVLPSQPGYSAVARSMDSADVAAYLRDLGGLLKERALEARAARDGAADLGERQFETGRLMGYHEVVSLMQQQAVAFGLDASALGLDDITPEVDLL